MPPYRAKKGFMYVCEVHLILENDGTYGKRQTKLNVKSFFIEI